MQNVLTQQYFWDILLGIIVGTSGFVFLVISLFRKKGIDNTLFSFGATTFLYGTRILIGVQLDQYVIQAPPPILFYSISFITYIIPIPLSFFILILFGRGWKDSFLWILRVTILFALAGIISDLLQEKPLSLNIINNVLIVSWVFLIIGNVFWFGIRLNRDMKVVTFGFLVFGLFVLNENLVDLEILPWHWKHESLGFIIFLAVLGYITVNKFFRNEKQLYSIQKEMETARSIQLSILPDKMPLVGGLDLAARYIPMKTVAGDFYDIAIQNNNQLCILIADVSGHGLGAALIASMIKVAFSSQSNYISDPAYVLRSMNQILYEKIGTNFATAGCLFIDTEKAIIQYAGAGHPPLLLWKKSKQQIHELCENGLMLGPFAEAEYSNMELCFEEGDRILLYTDGIIEAKNPSGIMFGCDTLKDFIKTNENVSAEQFSDMLLNHLLAFSGKQKNESMDDDLTLIVIDKKMS